MNRRFALVAFALLLLCAIDVLGRTGGGHSYSGGRSSGSSSGSSSRSSGSSRGSSSSPSSSGSANYGTASGSPVTCAIIAVVVLIVLVWLIAAAMSRGGNQTTAPPVPERRGDPFTALRGIDPNFSRSVFEDFCYALYEHAHHARGAGNLDRYAPFMSDNARRELLARNPAGLKEVRGIVIGAMAVESVHVNEVTQVAVTYDANMTEVTGQEMAFYVKERWIYERAKGVLSPPPSKAKAEHCPKCGAPLETRSDGACTYCGAKIVDGSFNWFVRSVHLDEKEERGPLLTSDVAEEGTSNPTIHQPQYEAHFAKFKLEHPGFSLDAFVARVKQVAIELQAAWSNRNWERVRPLETDQLFQTHRYWIDAYIKQNLRNIVEDYTVGSIVPVKVDTDAFYDAITVRMWAQGRDYTVDAGGKVVGGSRSNVRKWTEYWTFLRTRGTEASPDATVGCPNCGAQVKVGSTGICTSCGGKLTSGEFGWLLSRIEQDDDYIG